jgi:hypothetical protein
MFRDLTPEKFLYDVFIALLTGIVTGVLTGFHVDRRIKSRERRRLSSATNVMYVEVIDAINQLTKDILSPRFFTSASKMCEFKAVPGRFESGRDSQGTVDERVFVH